MLVVEVVGVVVVVGGGGVVVEVGVFVELACC